ncbi:hypothetical protein RJ639_012327 [Escallonia herrerae]|uniref:Uncharacterized protein n=1 Tax=Escallonia herrerae TaxID=1293975 RepID=A0AA88VNW9_9ASTE|nr:hypothetical protein RJ639_012327 [Escallonia herrerae]
MALHIDFGGRHNMNETLLTPLHNAENLSEPFDQPPHVIPTDTFIFFKSHLRIKRDKNVIRVFDYYDSSITVEEGRECHVITMNFSIEVYGDLAIGYLTAMTDMQIPNPDSTTFPLRVFLGIQTFTSQFEYEAQLVLRNGPWTVISALLLLGQSTPHLIYANLSFPTADLWVRISNIPSDYYTMDLTQTIGGTR